MGLNGVSLFKPGRRLRKMQAAQVAEFAAQWWPYANFQQLRIAAFLSLWLFVWDDETDSPEFSDLANDAEAAENFRDETMTFIRRSVESHSHHLRANHFAIQDFAEVGEAVGRAYTEEQRDRLLYELNTFVKMTGVEQRYQLSEWLPSVEQYSLRRLGSSAVGVCLAITEYCLDMRLPLRVHEDSEFHDLCLYTNVIISTTNDILSIKKEIAQDQVDSLIPLLYLRYGNLQVAVDTAAETVKTSVSAFEKTSQKLLNRYARDSATVEALESFIDACMYACTANLFWSLSSGRYGLGCKRPGECLSVTL